MSKYRQTRYSKCRGDMRPPDAKRIKDDFLLGDKNLNNTGNGEPSADLFEKGVIPIAVTVQLIVLAIATLNDKNGSTLKDIRKLLCRSGVINESTDLRPAMIMGLKLGAIARPASAVKAGLYGRYVQGDGIPIFVGRRSRPKQARHRKEDIQWTDSATTKKPRRGRKKTTPSVPSRKKKRFS